MRRVFGFMVEAGTDDHGGMDLRKDEALIADYDISHGGLEVHEDMHHKDIKVRKKVDSVILNVHSSAESSSFNPTSATSASEDN